MKLDKNDTQAWKEGQLARRVCPKEDMFPRAAFFIWFWSSISLFADWQSDSDFFGT